MKLKIDLNYEKDFDILKKQKLRKHILTKLSAGGFIEICSGHTSLDCVVVRFPRNLSEKEELDLKQLTEQRNRLSREISTLKKATLEK